MRIKKQIKNIIGAAITVSALASGSAGAQKMTTGSVTWFSTERSGYTYINVRNSTGNNIIAYYIGTNSAIATVVDNAKRLNQDITIVTDNYKIVQVR